MSCVAIPLLVLGAAILTANVNIGIRHLLPVYPFLYLGMACAAAYVWTRFGRNGRIVIVGLAAGMAVESLAAFPDYLAFFNVACGGSRTGIHLLSDSNLDWGQDLKLLAEWQTAHQERKLYLCYFGTAEPEYYGIRCVSLPGSFDKHGQWDEQKLALPRQPGVVAVSATALQGIYFKTAPKIEALYATLRQQEPIEVLGGTIYLFEYDPR
jgi:hypothetical protein